MSASRLVRLVIVAALACAVPALGTSGVRASVHRGTDTCATLASLDSEVDALQSTREFDAAGFRQVGKDFKKAAKSSPKDLQSAVKQLAKLYTSVGNAKNDSDALNALGRGVVKYDKAITQVQTYLEESCAGSTGGGSSASSGSGAGTLTLGSETIALESSRCFLEEQTAAGQKILFTAQASGTNAAGDDVIVDVSRYDASSDFAGDDVSIDIGDPRSGSYSSWEARLAAGIVDRSGSTIRATPFEAMNDDLASETVSFEISC